MTMNRALRCAGRLCAIGLVVTLLPAVVAGQNRSSASRGAPGRTAWGHPDLQGLWTNTTTTPLERPVKGPGKATLTESERAELDAQAAARADRPPRPGDTG